MFIINDFHAKYPDDQACLEAIFKAQRRHCKCGLNKWYRLKGRPVYACSCGVQVSPLANTIFRKSRTPLKNWFYIIYLFTVSKNGISAAEIERQLGVTYKTAWRMGHQIRSSFAEDSSLLEGIVEVDEAFIGGRLHLGKGNWRDNKAVVMGMVQRGGKLKAHHVPDTETHTLLNEISRNVKIGSRIISDEYAVYKKVGRMGYSHDLINHSHRKYVRGDIYTNTIEGFWSHLKRSLWGTHAGVSHKYLQNYLDEHVWRYNNRSKTSSSASFSSLFSKSSRVEQRV